MLREREQRQLLQPEEIYHQEVISKLAGRWQTNQFENLVRCGHEKLFRTCRCCGAVETFEYRCDLKFCPRCQWRISKRREEKIRTWAQHIKQPKHLVLTQKNFPVLTKRVIRDHQKNLARFRRSKAFAEVRGGCVSVEITNEGNGWHLHSHWLLDVDWLDMVAVSKTWGELVGQSFAIVKVKDVRAKDFVHELCKYLAKGSEIASWAPDHIHQFVEAIRGRRFFFSFGALFKAGAKIREQLAFMKRSPEPCECGSREFTFEDERQAIINEARRERRSGSGRKTKRVAASSTKRGAKSKIAHGQPPSTPSLL